MAVRYAVGAAAEEVVARCYLITRLTDLFGSRVEAVLFAAVAFASYHIYAGPAGAAQAFALGLVFGAAFLLFPRVWPLVIGHAAYNVCWELMAA
jgi:membrane protease YdiL (CAAX protease family)